MHHLYCEQTQLRSKPAEPTFANCVSACSAPDLYPSLSLSGHPSVSRSAESLHMCMRGTTRGVPPGEERGPATAVRIALTHQCPPCEPAPPALSRNG
eukprot:4036881-Prymnesium_polylepis.2